MAWTYPATLYLAAAALFGPGTAFGRDIPCGLVEGGAIHIDGLVSDWEGVSPLELAGSPAPTSGKPLVVRIRCNYDDKGLYLLVEVQDDILCRTKEALLAEDHLELGLSFGGRMDRLFVYPGHYEKKLPRIARFASGGGPRVIEGEGPAGRTKPLKGPPAVEVYDARLPQGYVIELRLPWKAVPAYKPGTPFPLGLRVVDGDSTARPEVVAVAETFSGERAEDLSKVQFQEVQGALDSLLEDLKASRSDIWWDKSGDIGGGPGRLLMIGKALGVISKEFGWQEVAQTQADVREVKLVILGDKRQAVAIRVGENGSGGSREVLRIYRLEKGQFVTLFAGEVRKQIGGNFLSSQVSYVKRGKAMDLVLVAKPPVGFTAESYQEFPATDVAPILLPWQDKRARYVLQGDRYVKAP